MSRLYDVIKASLDELKERAEGKPTNSIIIVTIEYGLMTAWLNPEKTVTWVAYWASDSDRNIFDPIDSQLS